MKNVVWINKNRYLSGLTFVSTVLVLGLPLGLEGFRKGKHSNAQLITVSGVNVPKKEDEDFLVYSDQGVFRVSDDLLASNLHEDPLFIFALGTRYRVQTRGSSLPWLGTSPYPVITQAAPVVGQGQRRDQHVACGNRIAR